MASGRFSAFRKEALWFLAAFAASIALLPPLLAALAWQSGQAMFRPALQALYTYFVEYTVLLALGVAVVSHVVRLTVRRLRRGAARSQ